MALDQGFEATALTVLYGQRHAVEITAAKSVSEAMKVTDHRFVRVELDAVGGSALTDDIAVPKDRSEGEMVDIPITYVPARNTVFLSIALGLAEVVGARDIFVGVNAVDYSGYPDCRPEFIEQFEKLANVATKAGVEGIAFQIRAPLLHLTKVQIIERGLELGVDYSLTHSCYDPDESGQPCRRCDSCQIRQTAFETIGLKDPALSASDPR